PTAPETLKALEEARARAESLFHSYSGACSKATNKQARDLFGRLATWEMHHFEEMDRAQAALNASEAWVDYAGTDFEKADPGLSDKKDTWDRSGSSYFNEQEALSTALENERANYTMFLGLAAKAKEQKERDFWTSLAADEDCHLRALKDQLDSLRVDGKWTWLEVQKKGAPKPSFAAAKAAVSQISPISTHDLPAHRSKGTPGEKGTRGDLETELLPPGWEQMAPEKTQKFRDAGWQPPQIADPKTPVPGDLKPPATAPSPGGGWVPMGTDTSGQPPQPPPSGGGWIAADKQHLMTPPPPETPVKKRPPSTARLVGFPADKRPGAPGRPVGPNDTAIMDRPLAHTGGRWIYEASVKTTAQLCPADSPPTNEDALELITGRSRKMFLDIVNRRGAQGWELLQLAFHKESVVFFWKRRE
ncbi:MAG: hypothetical protein K8T20_06725, partial [Planctomycetes bacterium]|nr:hypothetical protein [Planctomycetota bacterium]